MSRHQHTSARSRRVAAELRRLRECAGLSCEDVARRLGIPVSRVQRLESGAAGLGIGDVEAMLGLYGVPVERRAALLTLTRRSLRHTWWAQPTARPHNWRSLCHLESSATGIRDFQLYVLPCLLRTVDYSRTVLSNGVTRRTPEEVDLMLELQAARQAALDSPGGPTLHAIVDEHVLSPLGRDEPMARGQLRHLLAVSERPDVTFQVIPHSAGMHAGMDGSFTILGLGPDTELVYEEQLAMTTYYQTRSDLDLYRDAMASMLSVALSPSDTRDLLCHKASRR